MGGVGLCVKSSVWEKGFCDGDRDLHLREVATRFIPWKWTVKLMWASPLDSEQSGDEPSFNGIFKC